MSLPLPVGRLGLGCAALGNLYEAVGDEQATSVVDAAWDLGVRLFDTAPLYGHGVSETRLGAALRDRPRHEFLLATKVGRLLVPDGSRERAAPTIFADLPAVHPVFDFSRDGVLRSVEESLTRLGLDRIDLLHVHDPDDHVEQALAEAIPALVRLRDEGVVGAIGLGINDTEVGCRIVGRADLDWVLLANRCTLLDHSAVAELLPACLAAGVPVLAAGLFNGGLLANPVAGAPYLYAPAPPEVVARAQHLAEVCARHDVPLAAAALQWPLRHPAVAAVLVGPRDVAEMVEDHELARRPLPDALWRDLVDEGLPVL